jgi:hypothetical protein
MVMLTDAVDWTEMEARAERIRDNKLKNAAGRPPRLRATLGALTLLALRSRPYREVEEQIRYYAPARSDRDRLDSGLHDGPRSRPAPARRTGEREGKIVTNHERPP